MKTCLPLPYFLLRSSLRSQISITIGPAAFFFLILGMGVEFIFNFYFIIFYYTYHILFYLFYFISLYFIIFSLDLSILVVRYC